MSTATRVHCYSCALLLVCTATRVHCYSCTLYCYSSTFSPSSLPPLLPSSSSFFPSLTPPPLLLLLPLLFLFLLLQRTFCLNCFVSTVKSSRTQQSRRRREEKGKEGAKEREQPWKSRLHNHDLRCHILKLIYSRTFVCSTFCIYT